MAVIKPGGAPCPPQVGVRRIELKGMNNREKYVARLLNGVTDLVCEVIPRHAAAQKRILGFWQIAGPRRCNRVGAGAAVLLHRTLEWL